MKKKKQVIIVMLIFSLILSIMPVNGITVNAATRSSTISTQKNLNSVLKKKQTKVINVKTKKKTSFRTKAKRYREKTLNIKGAKITFKNNSVFKRINIKDVRSFIENGSGNILNVTDMKAIIEIGKKAKNTKIYFDKKDAQISLKVNGTVSAVELKKATKLNVAGKPKKTVGIVNYGEGSVLNVNVASDVNITLQKSANVVIGKNVTKAVVVLEEGSISRIVNNSLNSITVMRNGNVPIEVKSGASQVFDGKENASKPEKEIVPIEAFTISFETNGGSGVPNQTVEKGKNIIKPVDPVWDGFVFKGWYYDQSLKHPYDFNSAVSDNLTLYSKWRVEDDSDTDHTVTFVLNDGSEGAYEQQSVKNNHCASRPENNPTREGYQFKGWYDDATLTSEYDFSSPVINDITIYAKWGNPDNENGLYDSQSGGGTTYSVSSLNIADNELEAVVNANESCILVVGFYNSDGYFEENKQWNVDTAEQYGSMAVRTPDYCELTKISMEINSEIDLPEYYIVAASLYDSDTSEELCEKYICADYTEEYEAFNKLTINDFSGEKILNFDNNTDDNFGVLVDGIIEINCLDNCNILSKETTDVVGRDGEQIQQDTYIFAAPTPSVISLQVGDIVLIKEKGQAKYLLKIAEKSMDSESRVLITESLDTDLTDFYNVLKVNMNVTEEPESGLQAKTQAEVIDAEVSGSVALSASPEWKISEHAKLTGELKGTAKLTVTIKYDAKLFRKDYFECSVKSNLTGTFKVKLEGKLDNSKKVDKALKGVKVPIPTPIVGFDAYTAVTFPTEVSFSGAVSVTVKFDMNNGFTYNTNSGRQDVDKKSYSIDFKSEAKFEVVTGPKFQIGVTFIKDKLDGSIAAQCGAKITAELAVTQDDEIAANVDSKHACYACLTGKAKWFAKVSVKLKYKIIKDVLEGTAFDLTVIEIEGNLNPGGLHPGAFYLSLANGKDSIFGDNFKFGWGNCPNKKYRTIIETFDENDSKISNVSLTIVKQNGDVVKSGNSELKTYLYDGVYRVSGTINNQPVTTSFIINEGPKTVKLSQKSTAETKITGNVKDASTGNWIDEAIIQFKKGEMTIATTKSDSNGSFETVLPADSYEIVISKEGYVSVTTNQTIVENETKYMGVVELIPGNKNDQGGFSGTIIDALTGNAVSGVTLQVRSGANSPDTNDILLNLTTDSNGYYEYKPSDLFGLKRGLPSGQYTITASKVGYITSSFNIIVRGNEFVGNQNGIISPNLDDNEYRIVLRWGSTPSDLDSHYNAIAESDHVYYSRKNGSTAELDVDDTSSYGPETITVADFTSLTEGFVYSVHDFSNRSSSTSQALSNSNAYVTIYHGEYSPVVFNVPVGYTGTVWNVFKVDTDGKIQAVNSFDNCSSPENVGEAFRTY